MRPRQPRNKSSNEQSKQQQNRRSGEIERELEKVIIYKTEPRQAATTKKTEDGEIAIVKTI